MFLMGVEKGELLGLSQTDDTGPRAQAVEECDLHPCGPQHLPSRPAFRLGRLWKVLEIGR